MLQKLIEKSETSISFILTLSLFLIFGFVSKDSYAEKYLSHYYCDQEQVRDSLIINRPDSNNLKAGDNQINEQQHTKISDQFIGYYNLHDGGVDMPY